MHIKTIEKSVKDLLKSQKQFVIPRFQREYSWEKRHYKEFFDDLLDNLLLEDGKIIPRVYFLGTMLFVGDFTDNRFVEMQVVDGQQRLTSITILFSALAKCFQDIGETTLSDHLFDYIMTNDDDGNDVRVLKTSSSHPYFAEFIQMKDKKPCNNPVSEEELQIRLAYEFFVDSLEENNLKQNLLRRNLENKDIVTISIVDLYKAIRDEVLSCLLVAITTTSKADANMLFEILNGKGMHLSSIDLIKNKIFSILKDEEPSDYANERWKSIRDKLNSGEKPEGIDTFVRHYWMSKYKNTTKTKLYDDFCKKIKKEEYLDFLLDLEKNADYYMRCANPMIETYNRKKEYADLVQSLHNINLLDVVQERIALMALFDAKDRKAIRLKQLTEAIQFIEDFHFVYNGLLKGRPNRVDSIYSSFAIQLRKTEKESVERVIKEKLIEPLRRLFPKYSEFEDAFTQLTYAKDDNPINVKTKYALNRINSYYTGNALFVQDATVEHILPEMEGGVSKNIGNLVLLERDYNHDGDSLSVAEKMKMVYIRSTYPWMVKVVSEYSERDWNESLIHSRAKEMAKLYYCDLLGLKIDSKTTGKEVADSIIAKFGDVSIDNI